MKKSDSLRVAAPKQVYVFIDPMSMRIGKPHLGRATSRKWSKCFHRYVLPPASPLAKAEAAVVRAAMVDCERTHTKILRIVSRIPKTSRHYEPIKIACAKLELLRRSSRNSRRDKGRGRG